jgi:hypothetical protein
LPVRAPRSGTRRARLGMSPSTIVYAKRTRRGSLEITLTFIDVEVDSGDH